MRYPTESDFSQDNVYSSSRLAAEEILLGNDEVMVSEETPLANGATTETPIPTTAAVVPQTATTIPASQAAKTPSSSKKRSGGDREKRTPSFFSRSYVAWKTIANRGVYTPVWLPFTPPSHLTPPCLPLVRV
jgi:hypothetical protein